MKSIIVLFWALFILILSTIVGGCHKSASNHIVELEQRPHIFPDYCDVTVPYNIAPLNFYIEESGKSFEVVVSDNEKTDLLKIKSSNGLIKFPQKRWEKLLNKNKGKKLVVEVSSITDKKEKQEFLAFTFNISEDNIDSYLVYRMIHPGYYNWSNIKIEQRSLSSFRTQSIVDNQVIDKNCVNCHSFNKNNPEEFLIHIRGSKGGTYFSDNGKLIKTKIKTEGMPSGASYPAWHPDGRFVAFSSNQVRQSFYAHMTKNIEVYDLISSLILYDTQTNEIINITTSDTINPLQTFPTWSPDGEYLYFCRAEQNNSNSGHDFNDIKNIHYNLVKKRFQKDSKTFGNTEMVFNSSEINKSASFPRISPDGNFLVFTLQDYGTFPIWHKEADLFILDLNTNKVRKLDINSNETESYHTWSSNSKWIVFSSKRMDGRSARPFFTHHSSEGKTGKPFVLPQKDPTFYKKLLESFNIPELVSDKIDFTPRNFAKAANNAGIHAKSDSETYDLKILNTENKNISEDKGIHE
ncbi:cytochrome C biosynthesis protein [Maribellus comscasis]|uniref:Cytochrome C biosynthesis protein n=1 Tax=Maribellus comscasis TaxID=2681766 RepID=A0A6I6K275_9BACT|nr:PD40 domain-containing protein [Maribellus comscasis]QGY45613.1 cytochrome C biosynthesis protein [Maribellus comscasis]